jgi:hypothetical protein
MRESTAAVSLRSRFRQSAPGSATGGLWGTGTGTGGGEGPVTLSWRTNMIRAERTVVIFFVPVKMSCFSML